MKHHEKSPLAGQTVRLKSNVSIYGGMEFTVIDWFDRLYGESWTLASGNSQTAEYAFRAGTTYRDPEPVPLNDEILVGTIAGVEKVVHIQELESVDAAHGEPVAR